MVGLYVPADDRCHYIAWSDASRDEFDPEYWNQLYSWYANGGTEDFLVSKYGLSRYCQDFAEFQARALQWGIK
jgi:hypothetical protein